MSEYRIYSFSYTRPNWQGYEAVKAVSAGYALDSLITQYPDYKDWQYVSDVPVLTESIRTVLGDSRPVTRYYGTGEYDCPYCGSPCNKPQCFNPWCDANPNYSPERLTSVRTERELVNAAKERDASIQRARIAHANDYQERQEKARQETIEKARLGGYCVRCATAYPAKWVKHRLECPKSR
jgi:hypothetical protein